MLFWILLNKNDQTVQYNAMTNRTLRIERNESCKLSCARNQGKDQWTLLTKKQDQELG
jgi:hypothetical protein